MKKVKMLAVLNFIFYLLAFVASIVSQLNVIGTNDIGEVSAKYDTVFTPAGSTFAIWGIIYLSLFAFTIYHIIKAYNSDIHAEPNQAIQQIGNYFIINNIATGLWVFAWVYQYVGLSLILMFIQLYALIVIQIKIDIYNPYKSFNNKLLTQFPLSIYFAWICIATIANASVFLLSINFNITFVSPILWTIILITVATFLALFIILFRKNPFFGMVVIWAFYGIILKRKAVDAEMYINVIDSAWFGIALVSIAIVYQLTVNFKLSNKREVFN